MAVMGWAFAVSANSQSRTEADGKYATKESVNNLGMLMTETRNDVKDILKYMPRQHGPEAQKNPREVGQ